MTPEQIIKRPIVLTEKAHRLAREDNQVVFEVDRDANKIQIKDAVETLFNVKVASVNTLVQRGKHSAWAAATPRRRNWKKAIVTLARGRRHPVLRREARSKSWASELQADLAGAPLLHGQRLQGAHHRRAAERSSSSTKPSTGGRNNYGRITTRFRGGGHKQRYRIIDFKRDKIGVPAKVAHDRVRSEPHGAHRAPPLRRRREALHPRARRPEASATRSSRAATPTSSPATACRSATSRPARRSTTSR